MAETTALARLEQCAGLIIVDARQLADQIRELKKVAHVLTPAVMSIAVQHQVHTAVVVIDSTIRDNGQGDDTYGLDRNGKGLPWLRPGERALNRVGLLRIKQAAGVSWDRVEGGLLTDGKERFYWVYKAVGSYTDFAGEKQALIGTFELDLRDGAPALKGFSEAQIIQTRRSGMRICETKAQNAAIRELGLQQKYTVDDLKKPFVVLRTVFVPDMKDPMQRRLVAERGMGCAAALYPNARQIGAGRSDDIVVEPERVMTVDTPSGKVDTETGELVDQAPANGNGTATKVATEPAKPAEPEPPTGPTVTAIRTEDGLTKDAVDKDGTVTRKGGRPYTRHFIALSDGREVHTFDTKIGDLARKLMVAKAPIDITTQDSKWGKNIVELKPAEPTLSFDDDGPTDAEVAGRY